MAFATILAVVAGLTLTSASSVAHDLYANVIKKGEATREGRGQGGADRGVRDRRHRDRAVDLAQTLNIAFLVALAFAVAASANLPSLLYNLFWKRFNTRGATWAIYGGLITCVGLVVFSPVVSGLGRPRCSPTHDWSWFPLGNPGIISIPAGFFLGWLGTVTSQGAGGRGALHRARGPLAHRRRLGERPSTH